MMDPIDLTNFLETPNIGGPIVTFNNNNKLVYRGS